MTSNLGAAASEKNSIGFGSLERTGEDEAAMKDFFRPELRNRIDKVCKFAKLDKLAIKKIVIKFADELQQSLTEKGIRLVLSEAVVDHLADRGYDPIMGARPLSRKIDELIRVPLSRKILFEGMHDCTLYADMDQEQIVFRTEPAVPHVDSKGYIVVES
jgi:ATP-dependent Clp protease ATP-binding subunit ClpA